MIQRILDRGTRDGPVSKPCAQAVRRSIDCACALGRRDMGGKEGGGIS